MSDPRVQKLATMLVDYSLGVKANQRVLLQGEKGGEPLMMAIFNACLERDAIPFIFQYPEGMIDSYFRYGKAEKFAKYLEQLKTFVETYDHRVRILGESNTKELSGFDPDLVSKFTAEGGKISRIMLDREQKAKCTGFYRCSPPQHMRRMPT